MLRVCYCDNIRGQRWTLCGHLAGPWVDELRSHWREARSRTPRAGAVVDLSDVIFIAAAAAPAPPDVEVADVQQRDVPIEREWIGTLDGMVNAAIKAQVTGYLLAQKYSEGSFVTKGQLLFEIDPRPFQAAVDQAQGQLA